MANQVQSSGGFAGGGGGGTVTSVSGTAGYVDVANGTTTPVISLDSAFISRITTLENNEYKVAYFASVSASSGTITIPTNATILTDQFPAGVDALVSTISSGQPTGINPQTGGGTLVDVTSFDTGGNYVLTGTPSAFPVAIIYILQIKAVDWSNLTITNILEYEAILPVQSVTGTSNRVVVTGIKQNPVIDISASYVGQSSITTLGTIATGVWNGTTIAAANGGTGQTVYTVGDILYASTTTALSKLSAGAAGTFLMFNGTGAAPIVSTLVLPNTGTAGRIPYFTGTNTLGSDATLSTDGAGGLILRSTQAGASALAYVACRDVNDVHIGYFGDAAAGDSDMYFGATNNLQFFVGGGNRIFIKSTGQIGVGLTAPTSATAQLHIAAGTATASTAPLKFTSGINLTTAEAGAFEYNGTNLFFTRSGTTREGVLTQSAVTSETLVSDTSVTINIGGTTYKLLAKA